MSRSPRGALRLARSEAALGLALAVGLGLRVYQLPHQILGDDEWHAIHAVLYGSVSWVLSHFGITDHSIPLTLFYKLAAGTTGLSEMVMRAPVLGFGMATLLVVPLLVRARFGRPAGNLLAWLLAISPLHIYFSRYARPYAIALFFAFVGTVAFFEWWTGPDRRWGTVYAACAVLGPYFHLTVLPVLLAPLSFALLERVLRKPGDTRSLPELVRRGGMVATGLLVLLLVPAVNDWGAITAKFEKHSVGWATVRGATELHLGTGHPWLLLAIAGVALVGLVAGIRRQPRFLAYLGFLVACQLAVAVISRPASITLPITLARYSLLALPVLLLLLALGLVRLDQAARSCTRLYPVGLAGVLACAVLLYGGPLRQIYYRPNDWTNHAMFQYGYVPEQNWPYALLAPRHVPAFYHRLRRFPAESLRIVEAPWYFEWENIHYPHYQRIHRQRMSVGFIADVAGGDRPGETPFANRLAFRNFVHVADHAGLLLRGIRFVVFHKDLTGELPSAWPRARVDVTPWIAHYRGLHGAPVYEDAQVVVFEIVTPASSRGSGAERSTR